MEKNEFGNITLYKGDCMDVMPTIPTGSVDAIICDPPYGINYLSNRTDNHRLIRNDGHEAFLAALPKWLGEFYRLLTDEGICCCCVGGGKTPVAAEMTMAVLDAGFSLIQTLVWDKKTIGLGFHYRPSYENILVFSKSADNYNWFTERKDVSNILRYGNIIPQAGDHPTPKPEGLMGELISLHTKRGMLVLDPFMGGGTVPAVCAGMDRRCIGIEIEDDYYEMAKRRVEMEVSQGRLFYVD